MNRDQEVLLLADKVLGWQVGNEYRSPEGTACFHEGCWYVRGEGDWLPFTNLNHAWMVFRAIMKKPLVSQSHFFALLSRQTGGLDGGQPDAPLFMLSNLKDRFPEAICRAALAACGVQEESPAAEATGVGKMRSGIIRSAESIAAQRGFKKWVDQHKVRTLFHDKHANPSCSWEDLWRQAAAALRDSGLMYLWAAENKEGVVTEVFFLPPDQLYAQPGDLNSPEGYFLVGDLAKKTTVRIPARQVCVIHREQPAAAGSVSITNHLRPAPEMDWKFIFRTEGQSQNALACADWRPASEPAANPGGIGIVRLPDEVYRRLNRELVSSQMQGAQIYESDFVAKLGYPGGKLLGVSPHVSFFKDEVAMKIQHPTIPPHKLGDALPEVPVSWFATARNTAELSMVSALVRKGALNEHGVPIKATPEARIGGIRGHWFAERGVAPANPSDETAPALVPTGAAVCECGGEKAGTTHSNWCPKHS